MMPSLKRLTLGLILAGSAITATVAGPPMPAAAATATMTVSPTTSATYAPGVLVVGFNFLPGATVSLSRLDPSTKLYVGMGTAHVANTGFLVGTFIFNKSLLC